MTSLVLLFWSSLSEPLISWKKLKTDYFTRKII